MDEVVIQEITNKKHKTDPKKLLKSIVKRLLIILGLTFLCVIFLFPVVWMVSNSLKSSEDVYRQMSTIWTFLPSSLNVAEWFKSYARLFSEFDLFSKLLNSVIYCLISIAGVLLINSFAGYALARFRFPGSKVIQTVIVLLMIIPVETSIVPLYTILDILGLVKEETSVIGYLLPGLCSLFYIYMFRQFFLGMPIEIEEAARIDGCSRLGIYFKMILPLSLPIFATVAIFTFMGQWNEYIFAQLMLPDKWQPLQVFLQIVQDQANTQKEISLVMAALTFSTIPIVLVYIFAQKYIVEGVSFTGLK